MMSAGEAKLTLVRTTDGYAIRVDGRGTMRESPTLREVGTSCLDKDSKIRLTVDLSHCDFADSTFLGCLVALHKRGSRGATGRFVIAAPPDRRHALLSATTFDRYFLQVDAAPPALGEPLPIDPRRLDTQALGRHIMECHGELAEVEGPHQQAFARIRQRLADELGER